MVLASWFYKAYTFVLLCAAFFVVVHASQYEICMVTGALNGRGVSHTILPEMLHTVFEIAENKV